MSIPILLGNMFQQLYSTVDAAIVGRYLGASALAAVGSTSTLYYLILWTVSGTANGFAVVLSQYFGAKDYARFKRGVCSAIEMGLILAVTASIFSVIFIHRALVFMNTPDSIIEDAYAYIVVILAGLTTTMLYNLFSAILRSIGDSKTPFIFLVLTSVMNVVLDIVFIKYCGLGTRGAAIATVISQATSALLCLILIWNKYKILRPSYSDAKIDLNICKSMLRIGIPGGAMGGLTASGVMVLQYAINSYGADAIAAYTVATKVEQFFNMPLNSYSMTIVNFAGQNTGARKYDNLKKGINQSLLLAIGTGIVSGLILFIFSRNICGIFVDVAESPEVVALSLQYLHVVCFSLWIYGIMALFRSAMQGMGYPKAPLVNAIVETLSRIVWTAYLVKHINFKLLCFANPSTWFAAMVIISMLYFSKIKVIGKDS